MTPTPNRATQPEEHAPPLITQLLLMVLLGFLSWGVVWWLGGVIADACEMSP